MYKNTLLSTRTNSLRPCDDGGKASATDGDVGVASVRQKGRRYMGALGASAYTVAKWFAGRMRGAIRGAAMVCNAMDWNGEHIVVKDRSNSTLGQMRGFEYWSIAIEA